MPTDHARTFAAICVGVSVCPVLNLLSAAGLAFVSISGASIASAAVVALPLPDADSALPGRSSARRTTVNTRLTIITATRMRKKILRPFLLFLAGGCWDCWGCCGGWGGTYAPP